MLITTVKILVGILLGYVVIVTLAWRFQERLAFPAPDSPQSSPEDVGIADGQRVELVARDSVRLVGWYLPPRPAPPPGMRSPGLLWFYGNMETVHDVAPMLRELRPPGVGVLIIDYRGYGQSTGRATERGLYLDAEAAWRFLSQHDAIDEARIAVYGRSLGSVLALSIATAHPTRAVILDSPFTTAHAMTRRHYPWAPTIALRLEMDNLSRAAELDAPLLVFHGEKDFIAPVEMGEAVASAGRAIEFVRIAGAGHNDTYLLGADAYRERLWRFLEQVMDDGQ